MKKSDYKQPVCKTVTVQANHKFLQDSQLYGLAGYAGNYDSDYDIDGGDF